MKRIVMALTLVAALSSPAHAGLKEGLAAYERGDNAAAFKELQPLAGQGVTDAQFYLGVMYYAGQGAPKDYAQAMKWFRKAAERGDARAQSNLGVIFANGQGTKTDYAEAVKWFRKAAEQGMGQAQTNLGVSYEKGRGVKQDYVQAHMWYSLAAAQGSKEVSAMRDNVEKQMTPEQVARAKKTAQEWKPSKAAKAQKSKI